MIPQKAPPLPVVLTPFRDELLSSWINRHAAFYAVSPSDIFKHCLGKALSLHTVDLRLREDQLSRLGYMFATEVAHIRRMTFVNVAPQLQHFIARGPIVHACARCNIRFVDTEPKPVLRSAIAAWRITCKSCGLLFVDLGENGRNSPLGGIHGMALQGEALLDDEIERGLKTWASPTAIARLLLLRRFGFPISLGGKSCALRILGVLIPEVDSMCCDGSRGLARASHPILPLHLRRAWLAGVAIVMREGPSMLGALRELVLNDNPIDCGEADADLPRAKGITELTRQMQLIRESLP